MADRKRMIAGQRELAEVVGGPDKLVFHDGCGEESYDPEGCLCPVNVKKTLAQPWFDLRSGWGWGEDPGPSCDYEAWEFGYRQRIDRERYEAAMREMKEA